MNSSLENILVDALFEGDQNTFQDAVYDILENIVDSIEEEEHIKEISKTTLNSYISKAEASKDALHAEKAETEKRIKDIQKRANKKVKDGEHNQAGKLRTIAKKIADNLEDRDLERRINNRKKGIRRAGHKVNPIIRVPASD